MLRIEEPVQFEEQLREDDDHLTAFIKSLTVEAFRWLWPTTLESKPHLAD
jgi:hypothetical protein